MKQYVILFMIAILFIIFINIYFIDIVQIYADNYKNKYNTTVGVSINNKIALNLTGNLWYVKYGWSYYNDQQTFNSLYLTLTMFISLIVLGQIIIFLRWMIILCLPPEAIIRVHNRNRNNIILDTKKASRVIILITLLTLALQLFILSYANNVKYKPNYNNKWRFNGQSYISYDNIRLQRYCDKDLNQIPLYTVSQTPLTTRSVCNSAYSSNFKTYIYICCGTITTIYINFPENRNYVYAHILYLSVLKYIVTTLIFLIFSQIYVNICFRILTRNTLFIGL